MRTALSQIKRGAPVSRVQRQLSSLVATGRIPRSLAAAVTTASRLIARFSSTTARTRKSAFQPRCSVPVTNSNAYRRTK
jgi:hypothetical protein